MNFKSRLTVVVLLAVAVVLIFRNWFEEPRDTDNYKCDDIVSIIRELPGSKDVVVLQKDEIKNRSFVELRLLHFIDKAKYLREQIEHHQNDPMALSSSDVKDCITWETDTSRTPLFLNIDIYQQEFVIDEHSPGEDKSDRSEYLKRVLMIQRKENNNTNISILEHKRVVLLSTIVTKIKEHLNQSKVAILDMWCVGKVWTKAFLHLRPDVEFTCANVLPLATDTNKKVLYFEPYTRRVEFITEDFIVNQIDKSYDLIVCLELLEHLWFPDIVKILNHIILSKSKFVLFDEMNVMDNTAFVNKSLPGTRAGHYNLELPPFNVVPPVCSSKDVDNTRSFSLYKLPLMQKYYDSK